MSSQKRYILKDSRKASRKNIEKESKENEREREK